MITTRNNIGEKSEHNPTLHSLSSIGWWIALALSTTLLIIFLFLLWVAPVHATDVFIEGGTSHYNKPDNMLWWQDGYDNTYDNKVPMFRLGVEHPVARSLDARFSYFDLGKYKLSAGAVSDQCYAANGASPVCGPPSRFNTSGNMRGLALSGVLHTNGSVRLFAEFGVTYTRQSFHLDSGGYVYNECNWESGRILGLGVSYKNFMTGVYRYQTGAGTQYNDGMFPSGVDRSMVVILGYKF